MVMPKGSALLAFSLENRTRAQMSLKELSRFVGCAGNWGKTELEINLYEEKVRVALIEDKAIEACAKWVDMEGRPYDGPLLGWNLD